MPRIRSSLLPTDFVHEMLHRFQTYHVDPAHAFPRPRSVPCYRLADHVRRAFPGHVVRSCYGRHACNLLQWGIQTFLLSPNDGVPDNDWSLKTKGFFTVRFLLHRAHDRTWCGYRRNPRASSLVDLRNQHGRLLQWFQMGPLSSLLQTNQMPTGLPRLRLSFVGSFYSGNPNHRSWPYDFQLVCSPKPVPNLLSTDQLGVFTCHVHGLLPCLDPSFPCNFLCHFQSSFDQ